MMRTVGLYPRVQRVFKTLKLGSSNNFGSKAQGNPWRLKETAHDIHMSRVTSYPKAKDIPLPTNVEDINSIETARFSPQRARDITGDVIGALDSSNHIVNEDANESNGIESYDCSGTVSLNSAMQTNVPDPYTAQGKAPTHLNMPGGEWSRSDKYVAQDLQNSHYTNIREEDNSSKSSKGANTPDKKEQIDEKDDYYSKLKRAVKDYGSTVMVFHIGISLISLGGFYLAVISGLDFTRFMPSDLPLEMASEVGAFIVAYAIHKVFAPVRISITLFCTPFIVRYLRRIGFLKSKKPPV